MTKEEFVDMLTNLFYQSTTGEVIAYTNNKDVGEEDVDCCGSLLELCVDNSDDLPVKDTGKSSKPLYLLNEINSWPDGLFEKLSKMIWWIPPSARRNPLDMIVEAMKQDGSQSNEIGIFISYVTEDEKRVYI